MSIKIWLVIKGCSFHWECDWGRLENPSVRTDLPVSHLIVMRVKTFDRIHSRPESNPRGSGTFSATTQKGRRFIHFDNDGQRWTWELFEAHFWDGGGPEDLLIGRWPD